MSRYVALRFRKLPVVHWFFDNTTIPLSERQQVLTKTQHGTEVATILRITADGKNAEATPEPFVKEIVRALDPADKEAQKEVVRRETEAFQKTRDLIKHHNLAMKLLKAEYLFDYGRLILYYKAENKVDFRELLKSLASSFKTRIELRQIGVRDETKLLGGLGCCGKMVCCAQFMGGFHPVSTKMAKDQNLSMNPAKLSGICCRLLCCIAHEHAFYASFHGKFPKIGAEILFEEERARVMDLNYLTQKALIGLADRRKLSIPLADIHGRKDPATSRNLWWIQGEGKPEPNLSILLQPVVPPPEPVAKPKHEPRRGGRPARETEKIEKTDVIEENIKPAEPPELPESVEPDHAPESPSPDSGS